MCAACGSTEPEGAQKSGRGEERVASQVVALEPSCNIAPGYIGWWKFDEGAGDTTADSSGNGNPGVLGGGNAARKPVWTTGKFGSGLSFDGVDDLVAMGSAALFNITGPVTVEAWIKPAADSAPGARVVSRGGPGNYTYELAYKYNYGSHLERPGWMLNFASTGHVGDHVDQWIETEQWAHVALVYDQSTVAVYINGVPTTPAMSYTEPLRSAAGIGLFVGSRYNGTSPFRGVIDDVRIYNRALSRTEIGGNSCSSADGGTPAGGSGGTGGGSGGSGGSGGTGGSGAGGSSSGGSATGGSGGAGAASCSVAPGYVGWWKFDEGAGDTAFDSSGFGNTGVLGGGMSFRKPVWVPGRYGSALSFDGTDDAVSCGHGSSLDITGPITLEAWVKPTVTAPPDARIISKGRNSGYPFELVFKKPSGQAPETPGWVMTFDPYANRWGYADPRTVAGEWTHLAMVYDQSAVQLYVNGVAAMAPVPHTEPLLSSRYGSLYIGSRIYGAFGFQGSSMTCASILARSLRLKSRTTPAFRRTTRSR